MQVELGVLTKRHDAMEISKHEVTKRAEAAELRADLLSATLASDKARSEALLSEARHRDES